ncbi:MAG: caspase family protein [Geobacteraceae bacterium]|nr:caspase family protein [Geobacteraceae bacterium]
MAQPDKPIKARAAIKSCNFFICGLPSSVLNPCNILILIYITASGSQATHKITLKLQNALALVYLKQTGTPISGGQMETAQRYLIAIICLLCITQTTHALDPPKTPILRIETGRHTSLIRRIDTDRTGRWLVTASEDKTVRVWELPSGRLAQTIRPPIAEGLEGQLRSVAISPDGNLVATGGWTQIGSTKGTTLYLFSRNDGQLLGRSEGLYDVITHLSFSPDGKMLAASQSKHGIKLFEVRAETNSPLRLVAQDTEYGNESYGAHFSPDGNWLATTSYDGFIRTYDIAAFKSRQIGAISPISRTKASGGNRPSSIKFSPDGKLLAVGFSDVTRVSILSSRDLSLLYTPTVADVTRGDLNTVAWSIDGSYLYAAGRWQVKEQDIWRTPIRRWQDSGRGAISDIKTSTTNTILGLAPLPDGSLIFGSGEPVIGQIGPDGNQRLRIDSLSADNRGIRWNFTVSQDGTFVRFSYALMDQAPAAFSATNRSLIINPGPLPLFYPDVTSMAIKNWNNSLGPTLNNHRLNLNDNEMSRVIAIAPDKRSFVLGSDYWLRRFDSAGNEVWKVLAPAGTCAANVAPNGSVAIAAFGDGTIRWYRYSDGKELVAFFPHADKKRWILWTPEGFFDHSPGGEELIGFHLNRTKDEAADFIPASQLYKDFYRPDLVTASLEGKDISEYAKAVNIKKLLIASNMPPKVRIASKVSATDKPEAEINAEICDTGGGIGDITLYLNNMLIEMESGERSLKAIPKQQKEKCYSFNRTLTLDNGDNSIAIMVYNRENSIESERPSVTIRHSSAYTGKPNLHILTIAIDNYRDGDLHLKYSKADAQAVADTIQSKGRDLFGSITRHTFSDAEVTKERLEGAFVAIGKTIRRSDMFILFVAGHGITYSKDGSFYFLPVNFRYSQDEDIPKQGVSMNDLKRYLANIQASKSLLLLDTCNSGSFAEAIASRGILEKTAINKLTRAVGRHTIVASSRSQVALEGFQGHGAFSWVLLDGIQGKAATTKGVVTVNSLVSYVETTLPELTYKKWGYEQIPQKSLIGEDFTIVVK